MKGSTIFLTVLAVVLYLGGIPLFAQHGDGHGGGGGLGHGDTGDRGKSSGVDRGSNTSLRGYKTPAEMLMHNTKLASKLQSLLPAGTDLQQAASGFKNLGQFVACVHVSHNLGIPFDELKGKMMGKHPESLGQAIHNIKPEVEAKDEAKKARKQAKDDINESESESAS